MFFLKILLVINLFKWVAADAPKEKPSFISPLNIPVALSANFGELRYDHFHSGIDIKTQGVTGQKVKAAASGFIYRISVSPGGFGKAIYLRHPSGYSTVYAHLDKFIPEIEEYVRTRQYEEKSYMVTLWPSRDKFRFNQGDLIGYSGNSGSSSGPHLHYELRKSDDENPVNPLSYDPGIEDNIKPIIEAVVIYPAGQSTLVNGQKKRLKLNVSGSNGIYYLKSGGQVSIKGLTGFGIKAHDLTSNSPNESSVYSFELRIDSTRVFGYKMESFSFSDSRYVNSHIDYAALISDNELIERAFVLPNDKLGVYFSLVNRGLYNFSDGKRHHIEFIVRDINNNKSSLGFYVNAIPDTTPAEPDPVSSSDKTIKMPYNRNNRFIAKNIIVSIPSGTLYDTLNFEFERSARDGRKYSEIYGVHNVYTPVHRNFSLSIKPDNIPSGKKSKMLIVQLNGKSKRVPLQTVWSDGYLVARPSSFGSFYVGIDTVAPVISPNGLFPGINISGKQEMRIRITDDFSGIKSYEPVIDGKWALFEYDQKNNVIIYSFDEKRITKGTEHYFTLKATDYKDNTSFYSCEFIW